MTKEKKRKYFREKVGMVFRVPLGNDEYGYGQIITEAEYGFFDYKDDGKNTCIDEVLNSNLAFGVTVDKGPLHNSIWPMVDVKSVKPKYAERRDLFKYDYFKERYFIVKYDMTEVPSTPEEIRALGLECFASWGFRLVEDRLRDHFAGRKCYWVEADLNEHDPNFPDVETFYREQGYDYVWEGDPDDD